MTTITIDAFVYQWTDNANGKKYIGFHKGCPLDGYIGSGKHFKAAYKKRPECFTRRILAMGSCQSMRELETQLLKELDVRNDTDYYNLIDHELPYTGGLSFNKGASHPWVSERNKANKGKPSPLKGRPKSEEHKQKLSAARKGRPGTFIGKRHSEETRTKLSAARKGKPISEATLAARIGKFPSEESRQKMKMAQLARYAKAHIGEK